MIQPTQHALLEQSVKDLAEIRRSLQEETEAFRYVVVSTGNQLREVLAAADGNEVRLVHQVSFAHLMMEPRRSLRECFMANSSQCPPGTHFTGL